MTDALTVPEVRRLGPARLTAGMDRWDRLDLAAHRRTHGPLPGLDRAELLALADRVDLRGRGGAGFPFARKARAALAAAGRSGRAPVLVVNGTEGEPPSVKDATLLARAPHLVLDGVALAAAAFNAVEVVIAVASGSAAEVSVPAAIDERLPPLSMPAPTRTLCLPERFVSGESSAVIRAVNGEAALPLTRPARAAEGGPGGVAGRPTLLSNAETWAQLALAARLGPDGYAVVGTPDEPGTLLVTMNRAPSQPLVVEVPAGASLGVLLDACGVDPGAGVLVGGYHGAWLAPDTATRTPLSRAGLSAAGGALGAASIVTMPNRACALAEVTAVAAWLAAESAGQCGPCRRGLPETAEALRDLTRGIGSADAVRRAAAIGRGRGACAHPDGVARFVLTALTVFAQEVAAHESTGSCGRPQTSATLPLPHPAGERLAVDWARCSGHGLCASLAPDLIALDAHGFPVFRDEGPLAPWQRHQADRAVAQCPALALRLGG
ncbi:NADH-quinone oxidoreductase subunit NuoF family protein [Streptacidiphilus rugosus]|uniref:NADH-quinone oxidoreductase subunit NuoF family protein n=1 Tax=Streptacidiphilus rugosus TaxID=405783 RepID=UPI000A772A5B|nr:NADH-quinone oxidoreductase subunit NuoF family protein [Streptacidiphilus rugosus]